MFGVTISHERICDAHEFEKQKFNIAMEQNRNTEAENLHVSVGMAKPMLCDVLLSFGKRSIYIADYIKANAKTRQVPKLVKEFEELLKNDKRFYGIRTSEIFHLKNGELKRMPKVRGYWMSHINIRT